jgi:hypothetical protein
MPYFPENPDFSSDTPQYASERFNRQVEELLWSMDRPEISVTDESQFSDFYQSNETKWEDLQDTVKKIYGINIEIEDYLWETAEKIYNGNEN